MRRILVPDNISPLLPTAGYDIFALTGESMGTTWSVRLVAPSGSPPSWQIEWQQRIQNQLDTVVAQMSHWQHDSDLGRFNRATPGSWQELPGMFFNVLTYALSVAKDSEGAYDPTAGALVNAWGFGPRPRYDEAGFQPPGANAVKIARDQGGWQRLSIDANARKVCQPGGLLLDLSAVAKGYSVDLIARTLASEGIAHFLVEVGGELRGAGLKPDHLPWWVALERPPAQTPSPAVRLPSSIPVAEPPETVVALHGLSVATSGDYRHFYQTADRLVPHTIDPRTGYPIQNNIASVTVLHPSCMAADALSTALTVLGTDDGMAFADQHQLPARFLVRTDAGFIERTSAAFTAMLQ